MSRLFRFIRPRIWRRLRRSRQDDEDENANDSMESLALYFSYNGPDGQHGEDDVERLGQDETVERDETEQQRDNPTGIEFDCDLDWDSDDYKRLQDQLKSAEKLYWKNRMKIKKFEEYTVDHTMEVMVKRQVNEKLAQHIERGHEILAELEMYQSDLAVEDWTYDWNEIQGEEDEEYSDGEYSDDESSDGECSDDQEEEYGGEELGYENEKEEEGEVEVGLGEYAYLYEEVENYEEGEEELQVQVGLGEDEYEYEYEEVEEEEEGEEEEEDEEEEDQYEEEENKLDRATQYWEEEEYLDEKDDYEEEESMVEPATGFMGWCKKLRERFRPEVKGEGQKHEEEEKEVDEEDDKESYVLEKEQVRDDDSDGETSSASTTLADEDEEDTKEQDEELYEEGQAEQLEQSPERSNHAYEEEASKQEVFASEPRTTRTQPKEHVPLAQACAQAGIEPGLQVWRFASGTTHSGAFVSVPKSRHGEFFDHESYVIMNTWTKGFGYDRKLAHAIFGWRGSLSWGNNDAVADHAERLSQKFDCRLRQEDEDAESPTFLRLFKVMTYMKGRHMPAFEELTDIDRRHYKKCYLLTMKEKTVCSYETEPDPSSLENPRVMVILDLWKDFVCMERRRSPSERYMVYSSVREKYRVEEGW